MVARVFDETGEVTVEDKAKPKKDTIYNQLRQEFSKPLTVQQELLLKVPAREGIAVKFSTNIPLEKIERWRAASKKTKKRDEIDLKLFNQLIIISQCRGFVFNGEEATDDTGDSLTFTSEGVLESLGALESKGAVDILYVRDADILRVGGEILKAAGYDEDEDDEETDPLD